MSKRGRLILPTTLVAALATLTIAPTAANAADPADGSERYELEIADVALTGNAGITGCDSCSGGQKVGNLYESSSATITVVVPEAGTYDIDVHYVSGDDSRGANFAVNGGPAQFIDFGVSDSNWQNPAVQTIQLELAAGENQVTISADAGQYSPDFDALDIYGALPQPAPAARPVAYEAEEGVRSGDALVIGCPTCSGSQGVTALAGGATVTISRIEAADAATRTVTVEYSSSVDTTIDVTSAAGTVTAQLPAADEGEAEIEIELAAGTNELTLGGADPQAIIDRVLVSDVTRTPADAFTVDPNADDPVPRDASTPAISGIRTLAGDGVTVSYGTATGTADVVFDTGQTLTGVYSGVRIGDDFITTKDYAGLCSVAGDDVTCAAHGLPTLTQHFAFDGDGGMFIQLEATATDGGEIATSMIVPLATAGDASVTTGAGADSDERMTFTPVDNDAWARYDSKPARDVTPKLRSFEASALYDNASRAGLVVGSVERTQWKTGITATGSADAGFDELQVASGLTDWSYDYGDEDNRFQFNREAREHATLTGASVSSSKIFVAGAEDWREGMESFGRHVRDEADSRTWDEGTPFGYNSWGGLGASIGNDDQPMDEVSDFIADELPNFRNTAEGAAAPFVGVDSYWDAMVSPDYEFERPEADWGQLQEYVDHVRANGQEPAIYYQPFAHFWKEGLDQPVRGTALCDGCADQTLRQMTLKSNGEPILHNGSWALDPTNPGVQKRGRIAMEKFREMGFRYIKLDFLTNGYTDADDWFDPSVQSGAEALEYGMDWVTDALGDEMFIDLAISPLFMSEYAQARRISSDVHGAMNNWHENDPDQYQKSTEYLLNSVTYGWWLDEVYEYNDADHVQLGNYYYDDQSNAKLFDDPYPRIWSEGVNRARITSAVITGVYLISEDFTKDANPELKERAIAMLNNADVNKVAEIGRTFTPVEANTGFHANDMYVLNEDGQQYLAVFNFDLESQSFEVPFERMGFDADEYELTELWSGETSTMDGSYAATLPAEDAALYKLTAVADEEPGDGEPGDGDENGSADDEAGNGGDADGADNGNADNGADDGNADDGNAGSGADNGNAGSENGNANSGADNGNARPGFTPAAPAANGDDLPAAAEHGISVAMHNRTAHVSGLPANQWSYAYLYSSPTALGWVLADAEGTAQVTIPADIAAGEHRLAMLDENGDLVGWETITLAGGQSADSDAGNEALPATGAPPATGALTFAMLLLIAGAAAVTLRRRATRQ